MIIETALTIGGVVLGSMAAASAIAYVRDAIKFSKTSWAKKKKISFRKHRKNSRPNISLLKRNKDKNKHLGYIGEYETSLQLDRVRGEKEMLYNVLLARNEIDLMMIHETGIYLIENKNYNGTICSLGPNKKQINVDVGAEKWYICYGDRINNDFKNPIHQNEGHKKELLGLLKSNIPDIPVDACYSYVVFNEGAKVKGLNQKIGSDSKTFMCMSKNLFYTINEHLRSRPKVFTPEQIKQLEGYLSEFANPSEERMQAHNIQVAEKRSRDAERERYEEAQKKVIYVNTRAERDESGVQCAGLDEVIASTEKQINTAQAKSEGEPKRSEFDFWPKKPNGSGDCR